MSKWQSHNLRVSRLTNLYRRGYNTKKLMMISGHKSLDCLERYLKFPQHDIIEELLEQDRADDEGTRQDQTPRANETCFSLCLRYLKFWKYWSELLQLTIIDRYIIFSFFFGFVARVQISVNISTKMVWIWCGNFRLKTYISKLWKSKNYNNKFNGKLFVG